jgi:hypothetical protein
VLFRSAQQYPSEYSPITRLAQQYPSEYSPITCLAQQYPSEYSPITRLAQQYPSEYSLITRLAQQYPSESSPITRSHICEMIFTKIWWFKSFGLNLFILLGCSSSSSVDASLFGCVVILSVYLTVNFVIYFPTVGTFKS